MQSHAVFAYQNAKHARFLDEEAAYETQRKFNAITNELVKRYEVEDAKKTAPPKKITKAVDPA